MNNKTDYKELAKKMKVRIKTGMTTKDDYENLSILLGTILTTVPEVRIFLDEFVNKKGE